MSTDAEVAPEGWEAFLDESYYDLWAVRPVGERRWGHCFHLIRKEEAEALRDELNRLTQAVASLEADLRDVGVG